MSKHESDEFSRGACGGIAVAVLLGVLLIAAPKPDALQPIAVVQAARPAPPAATQGNGPTGYFPDRFRGVQGEDAPQPEAF